MEIQAHALTKIMVCYEVSKSKMVYSAMFLIFLNGRFLFVDGLFCSTLFVLLMNKHVIMQAATKP